MPLSDAEQDELNSLQGFVDLLGIGELDDAGKADRYLDLLTRKHKENS